MSESASGRSVAVNGAALHYEEHGHGAPTGGQVALELGAREPGAACALIAGAAYPDFDAAGLRAAHRALLGADETGATDVALLDAQLGEFAEEIKAPQVLLFRALPSAEPAICPSLSHDGPTPERAPTVAGLIRDFARRHARA